jgi:hypothetical protein
VPRGVGLLPVDALDLHHRVELLLALALAGLAHLPGDGVTTTQAVLADHGQRDVDVVGAGEVAAGADEGVVVQDVEDACGRDQHVVLEDRGVDVAATAAVPLAPAPTATAAPALVVVTLGLVVLVALLAALVALVLLVVLVVEVPLVVEVVVKDEQTQQYLQEQA